VVEGLMSINLDNGLVGYWSFNEGAGSTSADLSGKGNTGDLTGPPTWTTNGISGGALIFDSSNSEYVTCGINSSLNITTDITFSGWIKLDSSHIGGILAKRQGTGSANVNYNFYVYNDEKIGFYNGTTGVTSTDVIDVGKWTHILITVIGNETKIYINNELDSTHALGLGPANSHPLLLGSHGGTEYFDGTMDEMRLYTRGLNEGERTFLYNHPGGTHEHIPTSRVLITDLDDEGYAITDNIQRLNLDLSGSQAADRFSFVLTNESDAYSYIEQGCEIAIYMGVGGVDTVKLVGIITNVNKTLEGSQVLPIMEVSGEDWGYKLNHMFFPARFYDTEVSAIATGILEKTDYTTGQKYRELMDVSSNYDNVETTAFTIDSATFNWVSVSSAINDLANEVGYEWHIDTDKRLHFYDPAAYVITDTITDDDLDGSPTISDTLKIVNRAIVIGGYEQSIDQTGATETTTTTITDSTPKNESFVPTEEYLSSVFVHTEFVSGSSSNITISIQEDSTGSPSGVILPESAAIVLLDNITDEGKTELKFTNPVTVTPGDTYWMVLEGTTADGVKVGVDGSDDLDFNTRSPARVAVMNNDIASQDQYGMYVEVFRDEKIESSELAELKANQMIVKTHKKTAEITIHGNDIIAGDVIRLTITEPGVAIDKNMKVLSSSHSMTKAFILNNLSLVEI